MGHNESSPKSKVYSAKCLYKVPPELICLAAYVTEDGLVGHHWEERLLVLHTLYAPVRGNARAKKWEWVGREAELRKGIGNFQNNPPRLV